MKNNPYIAGNPVGGESAFIGRADVLRDVLRVLKSEHENGMVLYGQRRIGKTSVLQELAAVLPKHGNFAPVYFDLQDKAALSLDQVLTELSHRILYTLDIPAVDIPKEDFSAAFQNIFLPHVLSHLPEQTALVLLLDEFDVLDNPGNKQAGAAFFPYLRDLMAKDVKRLQFVFVIGRRPEDLSSVYLSLFKGVKSSHVSLMSEKDTADLVRLSEKNDSLKWTDDVAAEVYQLTGGHPFLTQQLCQVIWNDIYEDEPEDTPTVQSDDVKNSVQEAIRTATNSLEWLWNGLQPAQRIVASALAEAGPKLITQQELEKHLHDSGVRILIGELQDAPRVLAEWDVIQPEDGGYRMRVEMLRQWIAERKPLSRVRDEMDRILPAAENLFQAAYSFYQGGQLDDAEPLLRQSVRLNPNHIKANQLLAEILIAKGNTDEALKILETLYEYNPSDIKHRLVQVLLNKANEDKEDKTKILLYTKILKIEPNHSKALAEYKKIYESQGDKAYNNDNLDKALSFYKKAGTSEKIQKVNKKLRIETLYQKALNALERNEREKAQQLLAEVLSTEPSYKEATRYMHLAVTNIDIISLKNKIEELESKLKDKEIQSTESLKNEIDNTTADDAQSVNSEDDKNILSKIAIFLKAIFKCSFERFFIFGVVGGILFNRGILLNRGILRNTRIENYQENSNNADFIVILGLSLLFLAAYQIFALIVGWFFNRKKKLRKEASDMQVNLMI
jgi:tetratricopeptide (TPR) repeat protein